MLEKIRSGLTHLYAITRGGITDTGEYTAYGISRTVYWFHEDSKRMGDYSPLGTLLMNEKAKEDFSEDVVDYVFLHEVGHDQVGVVGRSVFWVVYLVAGLLFFAGIAALPKTLLATFHFATSTLLLPIYFFVAIAISIASGLPFIVVCWIDETLADLYAITKLGRPQYKAILEEIKQESESGIFRRIRHRIQYPPGSLILWIARKRRIGNP